MCKKQKSDSFLNVCGQSFGYGSYFFQKIEKKRKKILLVLYLWHPPDFQFEKTWRPGNLRSKSGAKLYAPVTWKNLRKHCFRPKRPTFGKFRKCTKRVKLRFCVRISTHKKCTFWPASYIYKCTLSVQKVHKKCKTVRPGHLTCTFMYVFTKFFVLFVWEIVQNHRFCEIIGLLWQVFSAKSQILRVCL